MSFDPAQYNVQSTNIVSATLGADGDTITIIMKQYDPITGSPSEVSSTYSRSFCQEQIASFTSTVANVQAFLNAVT